MEPIVEKHRTPAELTAKGRPEASFELFFRHEFAQLYRALVIVTLDSGEAEDPAQEAFGRLWERWERVSAVEDPQGYLYRTALNGFFQRRRRIVRLAKRSLGVSFSGSERDLLSPVEARDLIERSLLMLPARRGLRSS